MVDIGSLLFVQILQITEYPGAPFTGNPMVDIVQFFIIPTILLIVFVYVILDALPITNSMGNKTRFFFGVAIYLYIIVSGFFKVFAFLAGPYFLILIFVIGGIYFLARHFGGEDKGGHGLPSKEKGFLSSLGSRSDEIKQLIEEIKMDEEHIAELKQEIEDTRKNIKGSASKDAELAKGEAVKRKHELEKEVKKKKERLKKLQNKVI